VWFASLAALVVAGLSLGLGVASRRWSRESRGPFPYSLRWILALPHPITPGLVRRGVEPEAGNRILEIGRGPAGTPCRFPDPDVALREVRRVLGPGGRLAVGEVILDPDYTSLRELRSRAEARGFRFAHRFGSPFAYVAQFDAV
jgi:hypothetical protein